LKSLILTGGTCCANTPIGAAQSAIASAHITIRACAGGDEVIKLLGILFQCSMFNVR
jgi:hypothetical protein